MHMQNQLDLMLATPQTTLLLNQYLGSLAHFLQLLPFSQLPVSPSSGLTVVACHFSLHHRIFWCIALHLRLEQPMRLGSPMQK